MTRRDAVLLSLAAAAPAQSSEDARFVVAANECLREYLEDSPEAATSLGEHRYDHRLSDVSSSGRARTLAMFRSQQKRLEAIDAGKLTGANRIDYEILRDRIEGRIWSATVLREEEWNPMRYNVGSSIYMLLERDFAPLPQRLESVRRRLESFPEWLDAARANLKEATSIHTETAISQNKGTINLIRGVLDSYLAKSPAMRASVAPAQAKAIAALEDWGKWLASDLLPRANRDFRIGPEVYRAKLRHTLASGLSPQEIRVRAERDLRETQQAMYEVAVGLHRKYFPERNRDDRPSVIRAVLDKLAESRPRADTIVEQAKRELADAAAFVRRHRLVTVYDDPLRIVEMPEFQRGVAVAGCAAPGPYEKNGMTFYNISPPPAHWTAGQVESYFREYNDYMLRNLTVHEAMPGHYLQRTHSNRFHAPTLVRAVFSSGTFTEGWAVYAERIMVEAGYGGPEVRMQQLKMRLRTILNAIIDQGIHAGGMTERRAIELMLNEGFQERSEAAGKWRRACLTSTQLSTYFVGAAEKDQLRDDYAAKFGPIGDKKAFHDRLLSFGSPPPRYARELMGL
jgi:uncharacterized protein (DUF885 family)